MLTYFRIWLRFRCDIQIERSNLLWHCGYNVKYLTQRWYWHRGVWLLDVKDTAELDSAISIIPLSLTPQSQWYRWAWLRNLNATAELDSAVSMPLLNLTLRYQCHCWTWLCGINVTNELDSAVSMSPRKFLHTQISPWIQMEQILQSKRAQTG